MRFFFATMLCLTVCCFCGCTKTIPIDGTRAKWVRTVLETFDLLQKKDHPAAADHFRILKGIDSSNVYLSEFERLEQDNAEIVRLNALIRKNDLKNAEQLVRRSSGMRLRLAAIRLGKLQKLDALAEAIYRPCSAKILEESTEEFLQLAAELNAPQSMIAKAEARRKMIPSLRRMEQIEIKSCELFASELPEDQKRALSAVSRILMEQL